MMAFFVLVILIVLLHQISFSTKSAARVQRNEEALRTMDETIESVLLQVYEDLAADAEADASSGGAGAFPGAGAGEGLEEAAAEAQSPSDSREDDWARAQRTELNDLRVRILIQDENSKFNLLTLLAADAKDADEAVERLSRVIQYARKGTEAEIDPGTADEMADAIRRFLVRRAESDLGRPQLLTDDPDHDDQSVPMTLGMLCAAYPDTFQPGLFRDFREEDGDAVHSLGSFLTLWSSVSTFDDLDEPDGIQVPTASTGNEDPEGDPEAPEGEPEPGSDEEPAPPAGPAGSGGDSEGGGRINLNTAPLAVLKSIVDERDLPFGFWEQVLEYRNTEREDVEENEDPPLDEFGQEIVIKQIFNSVDDLNQIDDWIDVLPGTESVLRSMLDVKSEVFTIFVTVRKPTGTSEDSFGGATKAELLREEEEGQGLVRTVRSVVWRRVTGSGEAEIVPIVRWQELDYVPIEVRDYAEDDPYGRG